MHTVLRQFLADRVRPVMALARRFETAVEKRRKQQYTWRSSPRGAPRSIGAEPSGRAVPPDQRGEISPPRRRTRRPSPRV